jgi:magnesium chelatase family protein
VLPYAYACAIRGVEGLIVRVEANAAPGTPALTIIGLPDRSINESKDRARAAIINSGFLLPAGRLLVSLSPADVRKEGPGFDLPIALALLASDGQIPAKALAEFATLGELALDGSLRTVPGALPMAIAAKRAGIARAIVPYANRHEAMLVDGVEVYAVANLTEAIAVVLGNGTKYRAGGDERETLELPNLDDDFADVRGQLMAKRALEIAAAGGHNLIMIGPPGCGKTMLAQRLPSILPPMTSEESLDVTAIYSIAGLLSNDPHIVRRRPFRAPHHTSSRIALIGGGSHPRPGEVTLASRGVLYLDEIAEFPRATLEVLRQPLEDGTVTIARASGSCTFPARFSLVASMNPCPCGQRGERTADCRCDDAAVERYRGRISGPLLDRIDLHINVARVDYGELTASNDAESSATIRERVVAARKRQRVRNRTLNAHLRGNGLREHAALDAASSALLEGVMQRERLSARNFDRIVRVARTIADLAGSDALDRDHVAEALLYRRMRGGSG